MSNRLQASASPYLLQHQNNPVDWWEWSEEAFAEARQRDLPVFLSIGYAACHWCHVMAHESFEHPVTAAFLNAHFINVKVDREERPDLDAIYMDATVALTGTGGWPMSVFLDHTGAPFYAGTYFPPEPRQGMPSLMQLLTAVVDAWSSRREEVSAAASRIRASLAVNGPELAWPFQENALTEALEILQRQFDTANGGFGREPKFPPSMVLEFLLREASRTGDARALHMAQRTLDAMARGGMYDQLGGGFARYCVDDGWVVPHFEKMLYDNALLLRVYAHWWRLTGSPLAERVVRETVMFLLGEMRTQEGAFAASLDADSEGVEGRFYVWSRDDLVSALGEHDATWAATLLEVTDRGTFEHGYSTLQLLTDPEDRGRWASIRARLFADRARRVPPSRDDKVVAAWNGLVIAALADCSAIFDEPTWQMAAEECAALILRVHMQGNRLARVSRDGAAGRAGGVLADYANMSEGMLALAQATGDAKYEEAAATFIRTAVTHFRGPDGNFFTTPDDGEVLVLRPLALQDDAEPSGWAALGNAMLTLAALTGDGTLRSAAEVALGPLVHLGRRAPRAAGWALSAASALLDGPAEISVPDADFARVAARSRAPGAVIRRGPQATVCRFSVCSLPTDEVAVFAEMVGARS